MPTTLLKRAFLLFSIFILMSMACDISVSVNVPTNPTALPTNTAMPRVEAPTQIPPSPTGSPATLAPAATVTPVQPSIEGVELGVDPLRIILSPSLAGGARGLQFPRAEGDIPAGEITPGHIQLKLEGYLLQGRMHEPQIYVYPAQAYAEMAPAASDCIDRLNNIFDDPATATDSNGLPLVPFFNAQQLFASNIRVIAFQNGKGVRFLTEYAQYPAPANNHDLFYHFQGLTADGAYYIVAILPVSAPLLAEASDAGAVLPAGGIPYPYAAEPSADMQAYYRSVTDLLNGTASETFTPPLNQLDQLVQSIRINP